MKRVCMLGTSPNSKGGIGAVINGFVNDIHPEGYSFEHVVTHADCSAVKKIAIAGLALRECFTSLKPQTYDLVHIHSAFGASFIRSIPFIRIASYRGIPLVNHIHADDWVSFYENASRGNRLRIAETYGRCDKIIVLSQEWADTLSTVIPESKIAILENFTPVYEEDFLPNWDSKTIVFMSRLESIKGCDILPEICERVIARVPGARFLICGDGSMRTFLLTELRNRHLNGRVDLLGWISGDQKIDILKRSSIFLLPSYGEGMPMCILEAMGLGIPVVATSVGGVPQLVSDGVNGFLCDTGDTESIAESIITLLNDSKMCLAMSEEAKKRAALHSVAAYSVQLKTIYDELIGEDH